MSVPIIPDFLTAVGLRSVVPADATAVARREPGAITPFSGPFERLARPDDTLVDVGPLNRPGRPLRTAPAQYARPPHHTTDIELARRGDYVDDTYRNWLGVILGPGPRDLEPLIGSISNELWLERTGKITSDSTMRAMQNYARINSVRDDRVRRVSPSIAWLFRVMGMGAGAAGNAESNERLANQALARTRLRIRLATDNRAAMRAAAKRRAAVTDREWDRTPNEAFASIERAADSASSASRVRRNRP